ncbi:MAG: aldo/keto reductase [Balneolaceae bacterium]
MQKRIFSRRNPTPAETSEVGLGTWQLGGTEWGDVDEDHALKILQTATESGINFFDTADIYGTGRSEELIGRYLKQSGERPFIATKLGKYPDPGGDKNFSLDVFRKHTEASLRRLGVDVIDLTQLHSIPTRYYRSGEVFGWLDTLKQEGKIRQYGVSVESAEEAEICLGYEGVSSLQIIFNIFRRKPIRFFEQAKKQDVSLIVRLPLASGLLAGKYTKETTFPENDHRNFNRDGDYFNVGETFAGLPFEKGVELADRIKEWLPEGMTLPQLALRWALDFDAVSVVIPGASKPSQVHSNAAASDLPPLGKELHERLKTFYENEVEEHIRGVY